MSRLTGLIRQLRRFHGPSAGPPSRDPFHLLLWEQVAYLAPDDKRLAAYRLLEERVGLRATAILAAPRSVLEAVTRRGGTIAAAQRATRLRAVAERVVNHWDGNLKPALQLPFESARRELAKYPAVGLPGAERILLLADAYPVLGLDSNALRVLQRLGYGQALRTWAATYRSVQTAASVELPAAVPARRMAYLLLRQHGQTLCRRTTPRCAECPLRFDCPTGRERSA